MREAGLCFWGKNNIYSVIQIILMSITLTFEKKHFLLMGVIIAVPFLILAISTIMAAVPGGQYHSVTELFVDSDLDMGGHNITNAGKVEALKGIKVGYTEDATAGTLRWTGQAFEFYNGSSWMNLTYTPVSQPFMACSCPSGSTEIGIIASGVTLGSSMSIAWSTGGNLFCRDSDKCQHKGIRFADGSTTACCTVCGAAYCAYPADCVRSCRY